ncbi:hypothetical protein PLEOSDRAFT_162950 [Pleurotus ostreatus PC15]|uniref:Uncharacterized protein n=1 Tax=Pleurotus ostreatus (strain PC15) TaxID=1137138 RepID=A0A067N4R9_PLEO1|nr:hypothetical protein PLEOSDRAFT_162950 [Pleurotus ostreatus PC15]
MDSYDEKTGIRTGHRFYVEGDQSYQMSNELWTAGSTVSFRDINTSSGELGRLFTKRRCPKAFRWKPRQPKKVWREIIVEYANARCERNDIVVTVDDMLGMARRAEYNRQGEAHIQFKRRFSFGTSTSLFKVKRTQYYNSHVLFSVNVGLEFGNNKDCLRFIHHDIHQLRWREVVQNENDDAHTIVDDVCETVAALALDYRHETLAAIECGLSSDDFDVEFTRPETQLTHRRASPPAENDTPRCFVMLHLSVYAWAPCDGLPSSIADVHWTATDSPRAFPSRSNPFQYLNNFHLSLPSAASADRSGCSSSPPRASPLTVTFSAQGISCFTGTNSMSAGNGLTINGTNRTVVVNYIGAVMGDYFGIVNGGNVGGTNNTNHVHSYSR